MLGIQLEKEDVAAFRVYREEILRWSKRMNLTGLVSAEDIVRNGFLDSLSCAAVLPLGSGEVLDVGSGAGFPAIPLALTQPTLQFTLIEPTRKKVTFLRHAVRALKLANVQVRLARLEALLPENSISPGFDVAMARAVAPLETIGQMVLPFLKPGGIFVAQTGSLTTIHEALGRLRQAGFDLLKEYALPEDFGTPGRHVLALRKVSARVTAVQCFT